jgi:hypothetical protein
VAWGSGVIGGGAGRGVRARLIAFSISRRTTWVGLRGIGLGPPGNRISVPMFVRVDVRADQLVIELRAAKREPPPGREHEKPPGCGGRLEAAEWSRQYGMLGLSV